jgi:hypothetical protein
LYINAILGFNLAGLLFKFISKPKEPEKLEKKVFNTPKKVVSQPKTPIQFQSPKSPLKTHLMKRKEYSPIGSQILYSPSKEVEPTSADPFGFVHLPNRFQNALKPSQSPQRKEIFEDGLILKSHELTLKTWHVEGYIDQWSENMRKWLSVKILEKLIKRIDVIDQELSRLGWDHLACTYQESLHPQPTITTTSNSI